jgi:cellobiose PTS system EIIA component
MNMEQLTMQLIMHGGTARSKAMEAIINAKGNRIPAAYALLEEAKQALSEAHGAQTELIQREADGETIVASLLLMHAQDHLMNAITIKDMAAEFVDLYALVNKREGI